MDDTTLLILGLIIAPVAYLVLMVGGGRLYRYFKRANRIKRQIRAAPLIQVAAFDHNTTAKVQGQLRYLNEPLESPLSGRRCAYYLSKIEEYQTTNYKTGAGDWEEIARDEGRCDFLLDDGSATALIRVEGAEIVVVQDKNILSGKLENPLARVAEFMKRHNLPDDYWHRNVRYVEGILEEGELIAVCGQGMREPTPESRPAEDGDSAPHLVLSSTSPTPLYISDDPSTLTESAEVTSTMTNAHP